MSLKKQLTLAIIGLFLVVLMGTYIIAINNLRAYLVEQLETQAQNTATSLGVSMSQQKKNDIPRLQALIDSAFNTGSYHSIAVVDTKDQILLQRKQSLLSDLYPNWFADMIPINVQPAKELVMSGWKQYGFVIVVPETALAYAKLWRHFAILFWWFIGMTIVALGAGFIVLRMILEPLNRITKQADAIANRDFDIQKNIPQTPELRNVVLAMNKLSEKVESAYDKQSILIEKLRMESYQDTLTHLGNRRYFNMQLDHLIRSEDEFETGALFLIEFKNIKSYKSQYGFEALDAYLKRVASILTSHCRSNNYSAYRLSDSAFALIAPGLDKDACENYAINLSEQMQELHAHIDDSQVQCHIGLTSYVPGRTAKEMLSCADLAYQAAQSQGNFSWRYHMPNVEQIQQLMSASQWHDFLNKTINDGNIVLHFQPIFVDNKHELSKHHYEIFMRIPDTKGGLISAGIFIPMAENFDMMPQLDQLVIEKLLMQFKTGALNAHRFAVNISPSSLENPAFIQFLQAQLRAHPDFAQQLILELPEQSLNIDHGHIAELIDELHKLDCEFSLDHFGRGLTSVKYLKSLKIHYVKLDGSYTRHIHQDTTNQFFIHVMTELAHNFDIKVIAENVENDMQLDALKALNVDGYQGYLLGKPSTEIDHFNKS